MWDPRILPVGPRNFWVLLLCQRRPETTVWVRWNEILVYIGQLKIWTRLCPNPTIMSVYLSQGFESTSTLVAPPPPRTFVFSRSSVTNATIFSCDRPVYKIKSGDGGSRTELFDLDEQKPVASIKRRQFLPDVVAFCDRSNKAIRIDKWLNRRKVPNGQM